METSENNQNSKILENLETSEKSEKESYDCIFQPGIDCKGNPIDEEYISKIQLNKSFIENEINISNIIKDIPNYEDYFSPIIDYCSVNVGSLETKEIDKCEILSTSDLDTNIIISKIKYIGKKSLATYLISLLKENPKKFLEILLETHITLLDSLILLKQYEIIHNDIKENNIICRIGDNRPIIIDFGLSICDKYLILPNKTYNQFLKTEKDISKIFKYFFKYDTTYEVWCIEIILINYMLDVLNKKWKESLITKEQINTLLTEIKFKNYEETKKMFYNFLDKPWNELLDLLKELSNEKLLELIYEKYGYTWRTDKVKKEQIEEIIKSYINNLLIINDDILLKKFENELLMFFMVYIDNTWEFLLISILEYKDSWDNYALSITYYKILMLINVNGELFEYEKEIVAEEVVNEKVIDRKSLYEELSKKEEPIDEKPIDEKTVDQETVTEESIVKQVLNKESIVKEPIIEDSKNKPKKMIEKINEYLIFLKTIILCTPNERLNPEETKKNIKEIFQTITRTLFKKINDKLLIISSNYNEIQNNLINLQIKESKLEIKIYE